jgi:hypothetical protein
MCRKAVVIDLWLDGAGWIWPIMFVIRSFFLQLRSIEASDVAMHDHIQQSKTQIRFCPWNLLELVLMFLNNSFPSIEFLWIFVCTTVLAFHWMLGRFLLHIFILLKISLDTKHFM